MKDGVCEGWGRRVFMPIHLSSFPHPPHHPPQPLPLFSAKISSPMEKMLSHISHFQCVGVADSGAKIWTIKPPDSFRVCPRHGNLVLEEGLNARTAWGTVRQVLALGRRTERGKGSFTLPYLGCKAFPLHFPQIQHCLASLGCLQTKSQKLLAAGGFAVVLGSSPAAAHHGVCFGASPPASAPSLGRRGLLFFCMGLLKEPRAPSQKGEIIYLHLEKNVLYYTASEMLGLNNCQAFALT